MSFVTAENGQFWLDGERFKDIGFNSYSLVVDMTSVETMRNIVTKMQRIGSRLLRTWAFSKGKPPTNTGGNFQYLIDIEPGANILPNTSFNTNTTGWSLDSHFTRVSEDSHSGTHCIKQVSTSGTQNFTTANDANGIAVQPDTIYTLEYWSKMTVNSGNAPLVDINIGSTFGTTIASMAPGGTAGAWVKRSLTFNTEGNSKIWIRIHNNNGNVTAFYDDFTLGIGVNNALAWREGTLVQLDTLLDEARKANVKLMLCLADNTTNYDTKQTYVDWANAIYGAGIEDAFPHKGFYENEYCKLLYKQFIHGLVNRRNTINGRLYQEDDTIFSWELGNELRVDDFEGATVNTINSTNLTLLAKAGGWIDEMAQYIKSIDPNHMVGCSSCSHTWQFTTGDSVSNGTYYGRDYRIEATLDSIDYIDFHCYPTQGGGETQLLKYGQRLIGAPNSPNAAGFIAQLKDYIDVAKANGKPCVCGEIGFVKEAEAFTNLFPLYPRHEAFKAIFDIFFGNDGDVMLIWSAVSGISGGSYSVILEGWNGSYSNENSDDRTLIGYIERELYKNKRIRISESV